MDAGRLNSRITFQEKTATTGAVVDFSNYTDKVTVWAEARFLQGRNYYADKAVNVKTDVEFIIRRRTDIDASMRIKYENKLYSIEGIIPLDNSRMYQMVRAYSVEYDGE